jgi:lipoprotein-releasing system permease protein
VTGALLGLLAGYSACAYIETIKLNVGIGHMLISWDAAIYIKAFLIVVGSTLIASFIPARAAGRLSPIDIIRGSQ